MTFLEDLQRSEARAEQLTQQLEEKTKQYQEQVDATKRANQELGEATEAAEAARASLLQAGRELYTLREQIGRIAPLEQEVNELRSALRDLGVEHSALSEKHDRANETVANAQAELAEVRENLRVALEENTKAKEILDAFRAKAEAEKVLAGA